MAKKILTDVTLSVKGVDLSNNVQQISVPFSTDEVDVTAMGDDEKATLLGMGSGEITATLFQDFDETGVDATLEPLKGKNEPFVVIVKPTSGEVSKTNPAYAMPKALLPNYNPINGAVGAASQTDVAFKNAGGTGGGIKRLIKKEEVEALEE
jgi:hypothetical protein